MRRNKGSAGMAEDSACNNKVESVIGCHVEDAITFWAQNITKHNDMLRISCALASVCPQGSPVFGNPDLAKCQVLYIDYGNSEILSRSEIVEIPAELQFPSLAMKCRLWGLKIPVKQDLNQFDKGQSFLNSLIFEKEMKIRYKATSQDGTLVVQAECGLLDVGEEIAKKGFADRYIFPPNSDVENGSSFRQKMVGCDFRRVSNISLDKIKQDQKMIEENEKLKKENEKLKEENEKLKEEKEAFQEENKKFLQQHKELESKIQKLTHDLEEEKKTCKETLGYLEDVLPTYVGTTMKNLAARFEKLKEARYVVSDVELNYFSSKGVCEQDDIQHLILHRNEVQQKLYSAMEEFVLETLQGSLEASCGQTHYEAESSDEAFEKFFEWKNVKLEEFNRVRNATDASLQNLVRCFSKITQFFDMSLDLKYEDVAVSVDEVLKKAEMDISQELDLFLTEPDEKERKIILNVYNEVMHKIHQEQQLLNTVYHKYLNSVEFKKQIVKWLDTSPNIDNLLRIKNKMKNIKAQLRWKLVEKNNLEESDDYHESKMAKIKEEITALRNDIFQEICKEQEEYETLHHLVQTWFPELPLLHPKAGILKYMNSGGLLTVSLERDFLDAEPMKELSTKRPVVCSEVQGQKVLLKGYTVNIKTETGVIERAAKYHKVWREMKEESGLMQLMFLFLCKASYKLSCTFSFIAEVGGHITESLKVMKGVACGLHTLHKADIIHGSIHENNVFAVNREQGIVGDYDFTKSEAQRAILNSVALNGFSLISPEVKQGQPPTPASDMYAFGCLLYWLFIGKQEFKVDKDGIPQVDGLIMPDKVKFLLLNLLCLNNRMTSEQVVSDSCFLLSKMSTVPPEHEQAE
ncbi:hypothetical protein JD844_003021 [Phrynosoma platyrhinos]|uniref:Protein kinase domain-containing protein n=1 Tax=Phrynosoma platyrhinos TaxID=52577 RepID=A0ABQ7TCB1_PHRPL|nr:hypothetical protein JD844_003021 [Phrynosoma platyrhinos]